MQGHVAHWVGEQFPELRGVRRQLGNIVEKGKWEEICRKILPNALAASAAEGRARSRATTPRVPSREAPTQLPDIPQARTPRVTSREPPTKRTNSPLARTSRVPSREPPTKRTNSTTSMHRDTETKKLHPDSVEGDSAMPAGGGAAQATTTRRRAKASDDSAMEPAVVPGGKARLAAAHGRQTASAPPAAVEEGGPVVAEHQATLRALESHTKLLKTFMLSLKQQKAQSDALAAERSWHAEQLKLELEARTKELEEVRAKAADALQRTQSVEETTQMASELAARTRELEAEREKA